VAEDGDTAEACRPNHLLESARWLGEKRQYPRRRTSPAGSPNASIRDAAGC
jgi:hypothetical protein